MSGSTHSLSDIAQDRAQLVRPLRLLLLIAVSDAQHAAELVIQRAQARLDGQSRDNARSASIRSYSIHVTHRVLRAATLDVHAVVDAHHLELAGQGDELLAVAAADVDETPAAERSSEACRRYPVRRR